MDPSEDEASSESAEVSSARATVAIKLSWGWGVGWQNLKAVGLVCGVGLASKDILSLYQPLLNLLCRFRIFHLLYTITQKYQQ